MSEPTHTNHLIHETSPYLLQHAHNPVDWYPWGPEALARAKAENRPILLSIGYSACHWCHVMERESFEDPAMARLMNEHFVNIKVDREERPDLDQIYQNVVQLLGGQGGWPLTVFLTPDQQPFYGGTYYPPTDRQGLPGFPRVLQAVADSYGLNQEGIAETVRQILDGLGHLSTFKEVAEPLDKELLDRVGRALTRHVDPVHGGFGRAPKFPNTMNHAFLLRHARARQDEFALRMVTLTLEKMAAGGIFDHIGGGFHRYSVDNRWLVPHFEKMLYDNALLLRLYLEAWQVTKQRLFEKVVRDTLAYVRREMLHPEGGFYSTQDADSQGEEGRFFVWTRDEILAHLGEDVGQLFCRAYDVTEAGNFERGRSILNRPGSLESLAARFGMGAAEAEAILAGACRKLFEVRERRERPFRDEKILTSWNGLMISACAEAYTVLGDAAALDAAVRSAEFVLAHLLRDGRLLRTFKDGRAKLNGYLDDYAFFAAALLDLHQATFDRRYLDQAVALHERMIAQFWDEREGGFFFTSADHEALIDRPKSAYDHSIASGASVATQTMLRLHALTGSAADLTRAERVLRVFRGQMEHNPFGFGNLLCALDWYAETPYEIVIVGERSAADARALLRAVHQEFVPNKVVLVAGPQELGELPAVRDLLAGKGQVDGRATAYVCHRFTCSAPVTDPAALQAMLKNIEYRTGNVE
ncbi:MAG: thioredoxin domain-containing protein [candidate division NC10 bacterium]|nr:thioredoxin domain-containing protein [candidate division NC10 bacterium]